MSNLVSHAEYELSLLGDKDDPMQQSMNAHIMEMVKLFSSYGHSGMSGRYAIDILNNLLDFEPLKPLTGEDSEWVELDDCYQNKRCSRVFKDKATGKTYDIRGKIFREPNGVCFTNRDSHVDIVFPYNPVTEVVDVPFNDGV